MKCPKCQSPKIDSIPVNNDEAVIFCGSCLRTYIISDKDQENFDKTPLFILRFAVWIGIVVPVAKL